MPYDRPTIRRILKRSMADVESKLRNGAAYIAGTLENASAFALGGLAHGLHGYIEWGVRQVFVLTGDEDSLLTKAADYGLSKNPAEAAEFTITVTGNVEGYTISSGTRWTRADGVVFASTADFDTPASPHQVSVTVEAVVAGSDGNTLPGSEINLETPNASLQTVAVVEGSGDSLIGGGSDKEGTEAFRTRFLDLLSRPPKGGGPGDYRGWAFEASSAVTRVWELPNQLGPQTVVILFVNDLYDEDGVFVETQFPSVGDVQEVQDYIVQQTATTVVPTTMSPVQGLQDFTVEIYPDTSAVRTQVTALLQDLLLRKAEPSGVLRRSSIREAISLAPDEQFHNLISPAGDVVQDATTLLTLGVINFSEATL